MNLKVILIFAIIGGFLLAIYNINQNELQSAYDINGGSLDEAFDIEGNVVFEASPLPIPSGNLYASQVIQLPDTTQPGLGFTCTGLTYDEIENVFFVADIGTFTPEESQQRIHGQVHAMPTDFSEILYTLDLYDKEPLVGGIQGITIDTKRQTMWVCSSSEVAIHNFTLEGNYLKRIQTPSQYGMPTGIAYAKRDDSLWVLTYQNKILHLNMSGVVINAYDFQYSETLDQCFLDEGHGFLYITAGVNYSSRNNVYCFNINTHEQYIACTVDSYAVEGIWIGHDNKMIILNDGYYHSAVVDKNQVNIYTIN